MYEQEEDGAGPWGQLHGAVHGSTHMWLREKPLLIWEFDFLLLEMAVL